MDDMFAEKMAEAQDRASKPKREILADWVLPDDPFDPDEWFVEWVTS